MADTDVVSESLSIAADPAVVREVVTDFASYPEWLPEFKQAEVTSTLEDGRAEEVRYVLGAVGISITMCLAYTYADDRIQWRLVEGDMLHRLDGAYDLTDTGDGTTSLRYELEVVSSVPVPGMVRRRVARKIVTDSLKAIRRRAEARTEDAA